jgi:hypothetical protein
VSLTKDHPELLAHALEVEDAARPLLQGNFGEVSKPMNRSGDAYWSMSGDTARGEEETQSRLAALEAELASVRRAHDYQAQARERAEHERGQYRKLYSLVLFELDRLKRQLFGSKSESVGAAQSSSRLALFSTHSLALKPAMHPPKPTCRRSCKNSAMKSNKSATA